MTASDRIGKLKQLDVTAKNQAGLAESSVRFCEPFRSGNQFRSRMSSTFPFNSTEKQSSSNSTQSRVLMRLLFFMLKQLRCANGHCTEELT